MIMSKYLHLGARLAALAAITGLAACAGDPLPTEQPTFYRSMASAEAKVDGPTAASMITGYRHNNGLGAVEVDPELMRLAYERASAMAAKDKLDKGDEPGVQQESRRSRLQSEAVGGEHQRRLPHARRGILRLAQFAAAPRQHAQCRRQPARHRRGLFAAIEIQGVLGLDHGQQGQRLIKGRAGRACCFARRRSHTRGLTCVDLERRC